VDADPVYVVEGWIEQNNYPRVMVSRTYPYQTVAGLADLYDLLVSDAQVIVSSGNEREILSLVKDTMYTVLPIYRGYHLRGEIGKVYTLEVRIGNQIFTSTDTLLQPVNIDSAWFCPEPGLDHKGLIHASLTDPPEPGHCYRFLYKRLGMDDDYLGTMGTVLDDKLFNGTTIECILLRSGLSIDQPLDSYFSDNQTVVIKTVRISPRYFKFLTSVITEVGIALNPLNVQTHAITLMDGGALGGWGCFAVSLDTLVIGQGEALKSGNFH